MEEHKKIYLVAFAKRIEKEDTIDGFKRMIEKDEETIRASYSESTTWIKSSEFVDMVMYETVFIIEFILRATEGEAHNIEDPLMHNILLRSTVYYDLILLENQLPFFILEKLFDEIVPNILRHQTFRDLIIEYFKLQGKIDKNSKFRHLTDLLRCVLVGTLPNLDVWQFKPLQHIYNADKLDIGGVKLKAVGDEFSLNVRFENGCLEISCITVHEKLEMTLRNIMALEQCHYLSKAVVCNFVTFLDFLIDSDKDVDLLVEKGIIQNWIGEPISVARMVNKLGLGILLDYGYYYSDIAVEVNKYYSKPVNMSKAVLKRVYFGNLWTGTATIAATFLLVMTLIQTVASIIQVNQNGS